MQNTVINLAQDPTLLSAVNNRVEQQRAICCKCQCMMLKIACCRKKLLGLLAFAILGKFSVDPEHGNKAARTFLALLACNSFDTDNSYWCPKESRLQKVASDRQQDTIHWSNNTIWSCILLGEIFSWPTFLHRFPVRDVAPSISLCCFQHILRFLSNCPQPHQQKMFCMSNDLLPHNVCGWGLSAILIAFLYLCFTQQYWYVFLVVLLGRFDKCRQSAQASQC